MLDIPHAAIENAERAADWVELCCAVDEGILSRAQLQDVVHNSGLLGGPPGDYLPEDDPEDADAFSTNDTVDRFGEMVWSLLGRRASSLGSAYPFQLCDDLLARKEDTWQKSPAYIALLIADLGRYYEHVGVEFAPGPVVHSFPHLFEKIVQASQIGLFRGPVSRFGVPREPDWPTHVHERIQELACEIEASAELLDEKVEPQDGDIGLDIAARWQIAGTHEGTFVVLTQCATGADWNKKRGEPSLEMWIKLLDWRAKILRAIAVPWRADNHYRMYLQFDAMVLDRPRLCAGSPDSHIEPAILAPLIDWCTTRIAEFPRI